MTSFEDLNHHHRSTVDAIFATPTGHNIEWRAVRALLEEAGTVAQEHNGHVRVTIGPETEVLHVPRGKDIPTQQVLDLRRMLAAAGLSPSRAAAQSDERDRDHGDARWGDPKDD